MFDPFVSKLTWFLSTVYQPGLEKMFFSHSGAARCPGNCSIEASTLQQISVFQLSKWLRVLSTMVPAFGRNNQRFLVSLLGSQVSSGVCCVCVCLVGRLAAYRTLKLWAELNGASEETFCKCLWESCILRSKRSKVKSLRKYGCSKEARLQKKRGIPPLPETVESHCNHVLLMLRPSPTIWMWIVQVCTGGRSNNLFDKFHKRKIQNKVKPQHDPDLQCSGSYTTS